MQERNCCTLCLWSYMVMFQSVAITANGQTCWCFQPGMCNNVHGRYIGDSFRRENIALNKKAEMSSTYSNHRGLSGPASKANDGDTDIIYRPLNEMGPNCIHTKGTRYDWWQVDLGAVYTISDITIYPRYNFTDRMSDVVITVDGIECCTIQTIASKRLSRFLITCVSPLSGRIIKLSRNDLLNICEVEVWACIQGYYGLNCSEKCGHCKEGMSCNTWSGVCQNGCEDGFIPPFCKETCNEGYYGLNCSQKCGKCILGMSCNASSGVCQDGCQDGFLPPLCKEILGHGGSSARVSVVNVKVLHVAMTMVHVRLECMPGFEGDLCTVSLDQKCGMVENRAVFGAIIGGSLFVGVSILTAMMIWLCWIRLAQNDSGRRSKENNPHCADAEANENSATRGVINEETNVKKVGREVEGANRYTELINKKQDGKVRNQIDQDSDYEDMSSVYDNI